MGALVRTQYCPPNEKRPLTCGDAEQGPIRFRARVRCMCQSRSEGTSMNSAKRLWADALSDTWYGAWHHLLGRPVDRLPVVVIRRRTQREREPIAFQSASRRNAPASMTTARRRRYERHDDGNN